MNEIPTPSSKDDPKPARNIARKSVQLRKRKLKYFIFTVTPLVKSLVVAQATGFQKYALRPLLPSFALNPRSLERSRRELQLGDLVLYPQIFQ